MRHFIVEFLNNPTCLGVLCLALIMVPIIGIAKIHDTNNKERSTGND